MSRSHDDGLQNGATMHHNRATPRSLTRARSRLGSASVGLAVCTAATVTVLVTDPALPASAGLIVVSVALSAYWWMVVADARRPSLTLRGVVAAIVLVLGAS